MLIITMLLSLGTLNMVSSKAIKCSLDEDCGLLHECIQDVCLHKSLSASEPLEYLGSALIILMSALANSTGIGGGEIMVPLLILLFFFETHLAIPLSLMLMLGSSFINTALRIPRRHPVIDRPLISYDIVAYTMCPLLIGSTLGVLINRIVPDWLILTLVTVLLFYLTVQISVKTIDTMVPKGKTHSFSSSIAITVADNEVQIRSPDIESRVFPIKPCLSIASVYIFSLICIYLRGDIEAISPIGIENCSGGFWFLIWFQCFVLAVIAGIRIRHMRKNTQDMINVNYQFTHDVIWNIRNIMFLAGIGIFGGLGVGMLGIGGGAILNPTLIYLGMRPDVAQATAQTMALLTSSMTLLLYSLAGMIYIDYAFWFFLLSAIGASFGTWAVNFVAEKYQKKFLPVLMLAIVLGVATLATPTYVISTIVNGLNHHNFQYGFKDFCMS
ncbi:hypothetical protein SteCoe_33099 [Stentor coeruleus]|uniref:Membrane transporter protein n=1 Tax=Stentor coeruleus TaxID=5963 RepID=A0A1R2AXJ3_9CILI|nr:hypothetical protein SteCoe_33099 [Stentor coeruleus]